MWRFWGRGAWRVVVEKTDGKGLGFRWEDNIKMGIQEIVWKGKKWIDVPQDRTSGGLL